MDRSTSVRYSSWRRPAGARRFLSLTGIVLLGALATACGEDPPVPVEGSVSGTVTLEGTPLGGITVDLAGTGASQSVTTGAQGEYTISNVIEGTYTVTMSGQPSDTEFAASQDVAITPSAVDVTADFAGDYIRTARVTGAVVIEGTIPLSGLSVTLAGTEGQSATTAADGSFSFGNMRMGDYTVDIAGWDTDRYVIDDAMEAFSLAVGEQKTVDFTGIRREYTFRVSIQNVATPYPYSQSGHFAVPVGADAPGPLLPGNMYAFEFEAGPGMYLSFATMMVHSNDLFYAPGPMGIPLWDGHEQITGDVTDQILLWDAGTEMNQEPGEGADQPLQQSGPNTGEDDPNPLVRLAEDEWGTLPDVDSVIRVNIESTGPTTFRVTIENVSLDHTLVTVRGLCLDVPLAPGVFVVHPFPNALFAVGEEDPGLGLEGLAEDGDVSMLAGVLPLGTGLFNLIAPGVFATHGDPGLLFRSGMNATPGIEAMAEDGNPTILGAEVLATGGYRTANAFSVPVGERTPGPLYPGGAYEFEVVAVHEEVLSFVTMLVQTNDIFFAPSPDGIDMFPNGQPLSGDVTNMVMLWDAGTEVNEKPGVGLFQAPRQLAPNTGTDENGRVRLLDDREFTYPGVGDVVRVTVTLIGG